MKRYALLSGLLLVLAFTGRAVAQSGCGNQTYDTQISCQSHSCFGQATVRTIGGNPDAEYVNEPYSCCGTTVPW